MAVPAWTMGQGTSAGVPCGGKPPPPSPDPRTPSRASYRGTPIESSPVVPGSSPERWADMSELPLNNVATQAALREIESSTGGALVCSALQDPSRHFAIQYLRLKQANTSLSTLIYSQIILNFMQIA